MKNIKSLFADSAEICLRLFSLDPRASDECNSSLHLKTARVFSKAPDIVTRLQAITKHFNENRNFNSSFLYNETNQMHQFPKFTPACKSTCFGQFLCPSSGVYSQQCYMSYRFVDSCRAGTGCNAVPSWFCSKAVFKPVWYIPVPSVQCISSWWWEEELPETCRDSCRSKFGKLVHLVGFIIKNLLRCKVINYDARSHVTMHGHMSRCTVTCHDARSHVTMHGHMNVKFNSIILFKKYTRKKKSWSRKVQK